MSSDPYEPRELSPAELIARGLAPAGPLAPAITSKDPEQNLINMGNLVNPNPDVVAAQAIGQMLTQEQMNTSPEVQRAVSEYVQRVPRGGQMGDLLQQLGLAAQPESFLGRMLANAYTGGAQTAVRGGGPLEIGKAAGLSGILGGALEKVGQGARYIGSAIPKGMFDAAQESKIATWVKDQVPWWKDLSVQEMATSTKATTALNEGYEKAFLAAKDKIPEEATATIPIAVANALKLKGEGVGFNATFLSPMVRQRLEEAGKIPPGGGETVAVNARELLDKMPGSEGVIRGQIIKGLRAIGADVIPEATNAYKVGQGWLEYANRGGLGELGSFDSQVAQEALRKPITTKGNTMSLGQKALGRRGMGELEDIIQPPGTQMIESQTPGYWPWHLGMAGLGGALGLASAGAHGLTGLSAGLLPRPTFYKNVPAQMPWLGQTGKTALSVALPGFLSRMQTPDLSRALEP